MKQQLEEKTTKITISLDKDLEKKLRLLQAKLIKESAKSVSFSQTVSKVIELGLISQASIA